MVVCDVAPGELSVCINFDVTPPITAFSRKNFTSDQDPLTRSTLTTVGVVGLLLNEAGTIVGSGVTSLSTGGSSGLLISTTAEVSFGGFEEVKVPIWTLHLNS